MAGAARHANVVPLFEDFKPKSDWQDDHESHILTINLPGFMKEQIRVSTEGRNLIRVRGERLVAGNKWNRFQENFQVPKNGEMKSIRAMFQAGILTITVPKTSAYKPQEALPSDTPKQPSHVKGQVIAPPAVGASQSTDTSLATQETLGDSRTKQVQDDVPRDRSSTPFRSARRVPPQDTESLESSELKEKHTASERADNVTKKTVAMDEKKPERSEELHEDNATIKTNLKTGGGAPATPEVKKNDNESKGKQIINSSGADYRAFTMGKYKRAVKGLTELGEERQLLVNMGVAVLVIVAISAYVTYNFATTKDKS